MKTTAKYKDFSFNKEGDIELTLTIDRKYLNQVIELENTHNDKYFNLVTNDRVAQRTELQNNATWFIIRKISKAINGRSNADLENELYVQILQYARIKRYGGVGTEAMINELRETKYFPIINVVEKVMVEEGKEQLYSYWAYYGLSSFDKEENRELIECLQDYATKYDVDVTLETEQLRSLLK